MIALFRNELSRDFFRLQPEGEFLIFWGPQRGPKGAPKGAQEPILATTWAVVGRLVPILATISAAGANFSDHFSSRGAILATIWAAGAYFSDHLADLAAFSDF